MTMKKSAGEFHSEVILNMDHRIKNYLYKYQFNYNPPPSLDRETV